MISGSSQTSTKINLWCHITFLPLYFHILPLRENNVDLKFRKRSTLSHSSPRWIQWGLNPTPQWLKMVIVVFIFKIVVFISSSLLTVMTEVYPVLWVWLWKARRIVWLFFGFDGWRFALFLFGTTLVEFIFFYILILFDLIQFLTKGFQKISKAK